MILLRIGAWYARRSLTVTVTWQSQRPTTAPVLPRHHCDHQSNVPSGTVNHTLSWRLGNRQALPRRSTKAEDRSTHARSAHGQHCLDTLTHVTEMQSTYCKKLQARQPRRNLHDTATRHHSKVQNGKFGDNHKPLQHSYTISRCKLKLHTRRYNNKTIIPRETATSTTHGIHAKAERPHHHHTTALHGNAYNSTTATRYTLPLSYACVPHTQLHSCAKPAKTRSVTWRWLRRPFPRHAHNVTTTETPHTPLHARYHHTLSSHISTAAATMPWRSGNKRQQATP